ncbi:MAG: hypothetical protein IKI84_01390 [Clostridia bacterium]|nr:hypothetical protein [Clostridia bacterium]
MSAEIGVAQAKAKHGGIILFKQAFSHHAGENVCEHLRKTGQEMFRRQLPGALVPELLKRQQFPRLHDLPVVDREIRHPHGHGDEFFQGIRHGRQMFRRTEALPVIGDYPVKQGISDGFFALKMLVNARLDQPEGCALNSRMPAPSYPFCENRSSAAIRILSFVSFAMRASASAK